MLSFFLIYFWLYNFKEPKFFIVRNHYIKLYWNNNFYKIIDIDISRNFFFYFISKIVSTIVLIHTDLDEMN